MSTYTPNLELFKYVLSEDANTAFNIEVALNQNWDILDNALNNINPLPDQTNKSGYILTTNGSTASWAETDEIICLTECFKSGSSWYRIYSDGWCEQGGISPSSADKAVSSVTLINAYRDTGYHVFAQQLDGTLGNYTNDMNITNKTVNTFDITNRTGGNASFYWHSYGFLAEDE